MIRSSHFKDPKTIEAMFSTDLPGTVRENEVPNEIQWAPPGRNQINCTRGGQPVTLTVNVNEAGAQRVSARFAEYKAAADRGESDAVFGDFNHEDREASFHALGFRWGGDDIQRGGIRVAVSWTGAGRRAVLGRDYTRFSPSFYVDDSAGEIIGMPICVGGLVNSAAFRRIAPIMSKQSEAVALITPTDFLTKAKALMRAKNLDLVQAADFLVRQDPYSYDCYRCDLLGIPRPMAPARKPVFASRAYSDEFCLRASALADALGVNEAKAINILGHEQPALYLRYRAALGLGDARRYAEEIADAQARTVDSPFFAFAKQVAADRAVNIVDAFPIAARERPELADRYQARP